MLAKTNDIILNILGVGIKNGMKVVLRSRTHVVIRPTLGVSDEWIILNNVRSPPVLTA